MVTLYQNIFGKQPWDLLFPYWSSFLFIDLNIEMMLSMFLPLYAAGFEEEKKENLISLLFASIFPRNDLNAGAVSCELWACTVAPVLLLVILIFNFLTPGPGSYF